MNIYRKNIINKYLTLFLFILICECLNQFMHTSTNFKGQPPDPTIFGIEKYT